MFCAICREDISTEPFKVVAHMSCCGKGQHLQCLLMWFRTQAISSCLICRDSCAMMMGCSACQPSFVEKQEWLYILQNLYFSVSGKSANYQAFVAQLFFQQRTALSNPEIASCFLAKCSQLVREATIPACSHEPQQVCNTVFAIFTSSNPASLERQLARKKILRSIFSLTSHCLTLATSDGSIAALQKSTLSFEHLIQHMARTMNSPEYVESIMKLAEYPHNPRQVASLSENLLVPFSDMMQKIFSLNQPALQQLFQEQGTEFFQLMQSQRPIIDIKYLPNCIAVNSFTETAIHESRISPKLSMKNQLILSSCVYMFGMAIAWFSYLLARKMEAPEWVYPIMVHFFAAVIFILTRLESFITPRARIRIAERVENNLGYVVLLTAMLIGATQFV